jgi:hypothetical protein
MACFGLVFGQFLASIGDETTGTTLANGIFNTCFNVTGLAANHLLQRYTYRAVAFAGAVIFFVGASPPSSSQLSPDGRLVRSDPRYGIA